MGSPTTTVSVVVVSWNTRALLARCLESLQAATGDGSIEAIVVDNASTDRSADLVREQFPWVRLIASKENLGFGRAVNLGAREASGDWIGVANADIALREGALDALLEAGARDSRAGAIAPRLVLPDGRTQHSVFAFPTIAYTAVLASGVGGAFRGLGDRYAIPGHWDTERARRVPWAIAAFLLVRREAWEEVGGFDERQWMYAEDLDLGWRLRDAGWATRYEPRALVDHESSAATSQMFGPDLAPRWQRSTYGFIARRRGAPAAWAVAALNFLGAVSRWAIYALLAPFGRERHAEARDAWRRWAPVHLEAFRGRSALERMR